MKVYAFDVDETLGISRGPVKLQALLDLKKQGEILGICGNWGKFVQEVSGWNHLISFIGSGVVETTQGVIYGDKAWFLFNWKKYIPAEDFILVGNALGEDNGMGIPGGSDDKGSAERAGWRFIKEEAFARGER